MGWQPKDDDIPGTTPNSPVPAGGGERGADRPSPELAAVLEALARPEWRCPGVTKDEMLGLLRQAQTLESRAAAVKLGILRSLIRDDDQPLPGGGYHGDLPEGWTKSLTHEVALALAMPAVSADNLMWVAWDLQARLPGTGALLASGELTYAKARVIHETLLLLSDENAAKAEAMILPHLPGKTYAQVKRLAEQAAITVDPGAAARRREHAERNSARVTMSREDSGAVALFGRDLPTDQALAAHAHVCARAEQYKDSGAFPPDTGMDQFRAVAYLDLLNGKTVEARIASGRLETITRSPAAETAGASSQRNPDAQEQPRSGSPGSAKGNPDEDNPGDGNPNTDNPDDGNPDDSGPGGAPGSPGGACPSQDHRPRLLDLVLPLTTLLGLAERPGESHGLGPLDPDLCRELAVAAIGSPWTKLCVTVTDDDGIATGHGCARPLRNTRIGIPGRANWSNEANRENHTRLALPSTVNLTIAAARLVELAAIGAGPPGTSNALWSLAHTSDSGPPGGFGSWLLILPDGRQFTVPLEPMPTYECDHRHQSNAYQPNDRLRHLVQVRDYTCTFPPCNRHAKASDFEHAIPYDQGGATCACNAGARSRACHQVKQSKGWKVTQPKPGWHQWHTPSGRVYIQEPKRYPT